MMWSASLQSSITGKVKSGPQTAPPTRSLHCPLLDRSREKLLGQPTKGDCFWLSRGDSLKAANGHSSRWTLEVRRWTLTLSETRGVSNFERSTGCKGRG